MVKMLDGVRVLEMGTFITGPVAAMMLGDMGVDVVKIERPGSRPVSGLQRRFVQSAFSNL